LLLLSHYVIVFIGIIRSQKPIVGLREAYQPCALILEGAPIGSLITASCFNTFCYRHFDNHGVIYLEKCKAAGVTPNVLAIPADSHDSAGVDLQQAKLDGFVQQTPTWTKEGLVDHVVELIAMEDEVSVDYFLTFHCPHNVTMPGI
jgi:hypothetical protein